MVDMEAGSGARGDEPGLVSVQGRQGNVSFRPYRDIKTRAVISQGAEGEEEVEEVSVRVDMVEVLYPEILCHLFSFLDTQSKGRAAQVNIRNIRFLQIVLSAMISIFGDNPQSRYLISRQLQALLN